MKSKRQNNKIKLIWACAWCDPSSHIPLKKGEEYTHGICMFHKVRFLARATSSVLGSKA